MEKRANNKSRKKSNIKSGFNLTFLDGRSSCFFSFVGDRRGNFTITTTYLITYVFTYVYLGPVCTLSFIKGTAEINKKESTENDGIKHIRFFLKYMPLKYDLPILYA